MSCKSACMLHVMYSFAAFTFKVQPTVNKLPNRISMKSFCCARLNEIL